MSSPADREQLKRDCADALEALHRTQSVDGLAGVADSLRALGPPYRFHGELEVTRDLARMSHLLVLGLKTLAQCARDSQGHQHNDQH
jgi:hypothetical protein